MFNELFIIDNIIKRIQPHIILLCGGYNLIVKTVFRK